MDTHIRGMAIRGRTIYYCAWNKGLKMLNLSDESVGDIGREMSNIYYITFLLSMFIIVIHLLSPPPDDTARLFSSFI
jgi:hypothetical protein